MTEPELLELVRIAARGLYLPGADRDDLLQIGAIAALEALDRWDPAGGAELRGWVAYCVRARLVSALRDSRRPGRRLLDESVRELADDRGRLVPALDTLEDPTADVPSLVERRDRWRRLLEAVQHLSELERRSLARAIAGDQYAATDKAADNAIQRARRKLRAAAA